MNCKNCVDTGYIFDTLYACGECEKGQERQHEYNETELKQLNKRAKFLRKVIKKYKEK